MSPGTRDERTRGREAPDADKPPILKAYLDRCYGQVGAKFGVPRGAGTDRLSEIAPNHPVFVINSSESKDGG